MTHRPQPPAWARLLLAPNPGPMTLDGTNTWALECGDESVVVVDPGPLDEPHLLDVALSGNVRMVLLTHGHPDHSEGATRLHALTGAPVRSWDPRWLEHGDRLADDESIVVGDLHLRVLHTPGHTSDSVSFVAHRASESDAPGALVTGDTLLGRGTTVVAHPDGVLVQYLRSLERLRDLGPLTVLPGHGPAGGDSVVRATQYLEHRRQRLDQVRAAVAAGATTPRDVVDAVYTDVPPEVLEAAELSVRAQLEFLRRTADEG